MLKNLLATASVLAVTVGASSAMADETQNVAGTVATIGNAGSVNLRAPGAPLAGDAAVQFPNGSNFNLISANDFNTNGAVTIGTININTFDGQTFTSTNDTSVNAFVANGNEKLNVVQADNKTLTVTGNNVSALGNITLGNANGGATLKINSADTTLTGTINGDVAKSGIITVNAANARFEGLIGGTADLAKLNLEADKSATLAAVGNNKIDDFNLENGSTLILENGVNITSATLDAVNDGNGTLTFAGNSTAAIDAIGALNALKDVNIAGTVDFSRTTDLKATKVTLTGENAVANFSKAAALDTETDFVTSNNGSGKLIFANAVFHKGSIGTADAILDTVQIDGANGIEFLKDDTSLNANTLITDTADGGNVLIASANFVINANLGQENKKIDTLQLVGDSTGNAATTVKLLAGRKIHAANGVDFAANKAVNNVLELYDNTRINGKVDIVKVANVNNGVLSIKGSGVVIDGSIGGANAINALRFDTAGSSLRLNSGDINIDNGVGKGVFFNQDGTLELAASGADIDFTTAGKIVVATNANGTGTITANNLIGGQEIAFNEIGDVTTENSSLKVLEVKGGSDIAFISNASIKTIDIGDQNATVGLSAAGASEYLIAKFVHQDGNGEVLLVNNSTLMTGTNLGNLSYIDLNNKQLTVGKNVDLTVTDGIRSDNAGGNKLVFEGTSTVTGFVGSNNPLDEIKILSETVDFRDKVRSDLVTISDNSTVIFRNEIVANDINGAAAGQGTVKFFNNDPLEGATEVTAAIGTTRLNTVELGGANVTFNHNAAGTFDTQNLNFTGDGITATFTKLAVDSLQNTTITTTSTTRNDKIVINEDNVHSFNNAVGTSGNKFGNIQFANATNATNITLNNANFFAGIEVGKTQTGNVTVAAQNANVLNLGTADAELLAVTFANTGITAHEDIYSKNLAVNANNDVSFKKNVSSSDGVMLLNNNSTATFDGPEARSNVAINSVGGAGNGTVIFNNTTFVNKEIGAGANSLAAINFTGTDHAQVANVGANLGATNITVGAQTFKPSADISLSGATAFNGSNIELGTKDITNDNTITLTGDVNVNTTLGSDSDELGHFVLNAPASKVNSTGNLTVTVNDAKNLSADEERFTFFETANGANIVGSAFANTVKVVGSNKFVKWSLDGEELVRNNDAANVIANIVGADASDQLKLDSALYANADNTSSAQAYTNDIGQGSDAVIKESFDRLTNTTAVHVDKLVDSVGDATNNLINNRMGALSNHPQPGKQLPSAAVAAGEGDHTLHGVWASPFYSKTNQKRNSNVSGFDAKSYGVIVGADSQLNADMTLGLAGSYAKTDMDHKDAKSGDTTKSDTFALTIYGIQQLTNEWFLQGNTSFSSSKIKNTEKRVTSSTSETAKGSYNASAFSGELLAGYNYTMNDVVVTPLVGASYTRINSSGYKETGTTNQNLNISRKATNRLEGILGLRAQTTVSTDGVDITPEAHAFVKHDFVGKDGKVSMRHDGLATQLSEKTAKTRQTMFNFGVGVNAVAGMYEYGAGYDLNVAKKSVGHQGTLKVRFNF